MATERDSGWYRMWTPPSPAELSFLTFQCGVCGNFGDRAPFRMYQERDHWISKCMACRRMCQYYFDGQMWLCQVREYLRTEQEIDDDD